MISGRKQLLLTGLLLALLLFGLGLMEALFLREHREALDRIEERIELRNNQASGVFQELLRSEHEARRVRREEALLDPLVPAADLLVFRGGAFLLPPALKFREGEDRTLVWQRALGGVGPGPAGDDEVSSDRLKLAREIHRRLVEKDRPGIEGAVRAYLLHRARFLVPSEVDLPLTLAVVRALNERAAPDPDLIRKLLRDGFTRDPGGPRAGLMRQLLRRRDRFTKAEFEALTEQIVALAMIYGIPHTDFETRATENVDAPPFIEATPNAPSVDVGFAWYIERSDGSVTGFRFDRELMRSRVREELIARSMIGEIETVHPFDVTPGSTAGWFALTSLPISVSSLALRAEIPSAERRLATKTALVAGTGLLAMAVFGLGLAWQRRERALVELKHDFVSAVSHELRTPLASVRLLAETLERRLGEDPRAKDYPTRIVREIDEASFLVENILSFHRIDKGRWALYPETVDILELFRRSAADLSLQLDRRVRLEASGGPSALSLDPELARLLVSNLVKNAILYNERDPVEIVVEARLEAGYVRIAVRDNGIGVPEDERDRIFADFQRGSRSGKGRKAGSGLGLGLVRRIMRLHEGDIHLASSDASGSRFELEFPAGEAETR